MLRKLLGTLQIVCAVLIPLASAVPKVRAATPTHSQLKEITFYSHALKQDMHMNVYLPPGFKRQYRYPVLYLLHGWGGDQNTWMPNMGLNTVVDTLLTERKIKPMIIVAPAYGNSYGTNSYTTTLNEGFFNLGMYEDYLVNDVIGYVDAHFPTIPVAADRYIGGFSMGGWTALFLAFTHPDLFSKVGADSPALWLNESDSPEVWMDEIYPTETLKEQRDPIYLAQYRTDLKGLDVYLDCGAQDDYKFYQGTSQLYDILKQRGVSVQYHLNPGRHLSTYWKAHETDYILFYDGISKQA